MVGKGKPREEALDLLLDTTLRIAAGTEDGDDSFVERKHGLAGE